MDYEAIYEDVVAKLMDSWYVEYSVKCDEKLCNYYAISIKDYLERKGLDVEDVWILDDEVYLLVKRWWYVKEV